MPHRKVQSKPKVFFSLLSGNNGDCKCFMKPAYLSLAISFLDIRPPPSHPQNIQESYIEKKVISFLSSQIHIASTLVYSCICFPNLFLKDLLLSCGTAMILYVMQRMPKWYAWYYYVNPFAYSLQGIVLSQLGDVEDELSLPDGGSVNVKEALALTFGYHHDFLGYTVLIMIAFSLVFIVSGLICLHSLRFQTR